MSIQTSTVHRNLESKLKIFGFEAFDLLFVLIIASSMNLIFAQTKLAVVFVVGLPSCLLLCLHFLKKDQAENYLVHLLRYHLQSDFQSAGEESEIEHKYRGRIYE